MIFAGQNMHLLLSLLIKHIEHKAMLKQPDMQLNVVEVAATLAELSNAPASASTIGAISDLVRHLKRTFHITLGSKDTELVKWNEKFRDAIDECLVQLSKKVLLTFSHYLKFMLSFLTEYQNTTISLIC
jgi:protein EFR3